GKAGLSADDAIFSDDPESDAAAPYINIWAARADDADNPTFAKLAEIYHDSAVEDGVQEVAGGTAAFLDKDPADLQDTHTGQVKEITGSSASSTTDSSAIIRLEGDPKSFGDRRAVDDVSLEITAGEIFGVIGYSGAGKSTLVRLINALERHDSGEITVAG